MGRTHRHARTGGRASRRCLHASVPAASSSRAPGRSDVVGHEQAVADALFAAGTGLFRTMPAVDDRGVRRLRHTAQAFGLDWPGDVPLDRFEPTLDPDDPGTAAFQLAVRRASGKASYEPFRAGVVPWHAAVAATSTHATAPLRRLADRFVVEAAVSVAADRPSRTRPGRSGRVDARRVDPGDEVWVRLVRVDVGERRVEFERVA